MRVLHKRDFGVCVGRRGCPYPDYLSCRRYQLVVGRRGRQLAVRAGSGFRRPCVSEVVSVVVVVVMCGGGGVGVGWRGVGGGGG